MLLTLEFNLIGALTVKPYSFKARSWELNYVNSIDFFDSVASNVKLELRGKKLLRVLPRQNDHLNENWITDKSRFSLDSLFNQRLSNFYQKRSDSTFKEIDYLSCSFLINIEFLFSLFFKKFGKWSINIFGLLDPYMSNENLFCFKDWINLWGSSNIINSLDFSKNLDFTFRSNFIFKDGISSLLNIDLCMLLNINPRVENPIINLKLRKNFLKNKLIIVSFGRINNPNYTIKCLGVTTKSFVDFVEGRHKFSSILFNYKNIKLLVGNSILYRSDSFIFFNLLNKLKILLI